MMQFGPQGAKGKGTMPVRFQLGNACLPARAMLEPGYHAIY